MRKYTRLKEDANMNRSIRPELCNSTITNAPQKTLVFSFQKLVYFCFFPALFIGKNQWCLNRIQQLTENDEHFGCHVSCGGGIYAIGPICIYLHTHIYTLNVGPRSYKLVYKSHEYHSYKYHRTS